MLLIRLPVNSKLLVVKFWGVESYRWIFDHVWGWVPYVVQGLTVFFLESIIKHELRVTWVAKSVKRLTLDFGSGHNLTVS